MDKATLIKSFEAVVYICTFLAGKKEYQQEANKLAKAVTSQIKIDVTLETLAKFKYLLPDDIVFEYQETPYDIELQEIPSHILVFEFREKADYKNSAKKAPGQIKTRIDKFNGMLDQFLSRRSLQDLDELSLEYLPEPILFEESQRETIVEKYTFQESLNELKESAISVRTVPAREPHYGSTPRTLQHILDEKGIGHLYTHQSEGLDYLEKGYNIVVTTSTASGKSLIFHCPVIKMLEDVPEATSLFIFPTKALAQDQCQTFAKSAHNAIIGTYDGDTPQEKRKFLQSNAQVLFCNPDILHMTILPKWQEWHRLLDNLKYVVIDELHSYSGLFGAHTSMIIRRLRRICHQIGNDSLQFITCSATIQNPLKLMSDITGLPDATIKVVDNDGSPSGAKHYLYMTTPHMVPDDPASGRVHPIALAAPILLKLVASGLRVIAFCQHRRTCELLMKAVRKQANDSGQSELLSAIMSYRGGYTADDRRKIEKGMFNGDLRGIVATSALEVGIDIGNLDSAIIVGFPFSLSSFRQQVGRVGRRNKESMVVYIANGTVLDMSYIEDPDLLFNQPDPLLPLSFEDTVILSHMRCSAYELALDDTDRQFFPGDWNTLLTELSYENGLYHCPTKFLPEPSKAVNIRSMEEEETAVIDITNNRNVILEKVEFSRIGWVIYQGAIYINQGKPYLVVELDPDLVFAKVVRTSVTWTTRQRDYTDIDPILSEKTSVLGANDEHICAFGKALKKTVVFGYFKVDARNKILDAVDVDLPPWQRQCIGLWINLPSGTLSALRVKKLSVAGAIHGTEHILINLASQFVACSINDIGTECKAPEKELSKRQTSRIRPARLILYERNGGESGSGILRTLFGCLKELVCCALKLIDNCKCNYGCSECIAFSGCTEKNVVISKAGTQVILRLMAGKSIDDISEGPEPNIGAITIETICPVSVPVQSKSLTDTTVKKE